MGSLVPFLRPGRGISHQSKLDLALHMIDAVGQNADAIANGKDFS